MFDGVIISFSSRASCLERMGGHIILNVRVRPVVMIDHVILPSRLQV